MDIKKLIIEEIGLSNISYERLIEVTERLSLKKKDFLLQQDTYADRPQVGQQRSGKHPEAGACQRKYNGNRSHYGGRIP